jgi:predicted metal-dependent phosphoesterase TrpH
MPARQPFTALCRSASRKPKTGRSDLHVHTRHSDGTYTAAQVVDLSVRAGLAAVAITDHDTLAGVPRAVQTARGTGPEIIPGVEVTSEHDGRELHILGYFVALDHAPLLEALARLRSHRLERFREMIGRLRECGVALDDTRLQNDPEYEVLGRRHVAELLVEAGKASTVREAFQRYLSDRGRLAVPKLRLPAREAIGLIRSAGGVACWAHPWGQCSRAALGQLREDGLGAVEAYYPGYRAGQIRQLSTWAAEFGLAVTGGSDCHGPEQPGRCVGACTIDAGQLARLREQAGC